MSSGGQARRRDWWFAVAVWLTVTAVGELVVVRANYLPGEFSEEARTSDAAFRFLVVMAVPVFAFVVAMLVTAFVRFRVRGEPTEDGPPLRASRAVYVGWFGVTTALALFLVVHPGLSGLAEMRGDNSADLVVEVTGSRWSWKVSYPGAQVDALDELVLPTDSRIRFDVTATDVLHSFWVPAFRTKIDAVPGRVTQAYVTLDREGDSAMDPNLRLQCAEICGLMHSTMALPVRVVSQAEFESWLSAHRTGPPASTSSTTAPAADEGSSQ